MGEKDNQKRGQTRRKAMTDEERLLRERLEKHPLTSAQDVARMYGDDFAHSNRALQSLESKGLAQSMNAGYSLRKQRRYWVITKRTGGKAATPPPRHGGLFHSLLKRMTLTESVYRIIGDALADNPSRRLLELHWHFDAAVDATARFNDGWMAFKWSGIWQTYHKLSDQMEHLHRNLRAWRPGGIAPLPGRFCFVVPDHWQAELVSRVVHMFSLGDRSLIYNAASCETQGDYDLSRSRGRPPRPGMERWNRAPNLLDDLTRQMMTFENSRALLQVLTTVEQWPGISRSSLKNITKLNGASITSSLSLSLELDLVWQVDQGGYAPARRWLALAAERDRVWSGEATKRFSREKVENYYAGRIARHEEGTAKLVSWFAAAGCPVAPGWRFQDIMGKDGQVAPDAVIYLRDSPFGATWFYLEYELRAATPRLVPKKVRAYKSRLRSDDFPVMVVCQPNAVQHFLREGSDVRMLVASVKDVRRSNVMGDSGTVWIQGGHPVLRMVP